jgi:anti-sigma-K factor RskA
MNWFSHPALLDRLAAEYALGTLAGGARRRFETVMRERPPAPRAAARWAERLAGMDSHSSPLPASQALWRRIENKAFGGADAARGGPREAAPRGDASRPRAASGAGSGAAASGWRRWLAPGFALAFGIVLGIGLPSWQRTTGPGMSRTTQLPESYVGVLATASGRPGLIVSSLRRGQVVDLKVVQRVPVAAGQVLWLWTLDGQGQPQAVGPLPANLGEAGANFVSVPLPRPAEELFARAVELAVSVEPAGAAPAAPGGAFVYRGLCGKLWPVVAAASAAASSPAPPASR